MKKQRHSLAALFFVAGFALLTACSVSSPTTGAAEQPSAPDTESEDHAGTATPTGEYVPNHIILGKEGIQVAPSTQCSIFDKQTISIAGVGNNEDAIEFAFDVFDEDDVTLSLTTSDGVQWLPNGTLSYRVEAENRVTGLTELVPETGGDALPVSFAFTCE